MPCCSARFAMIISSLFIRNKTISENGSTFFVFVLSISLSCNNFALVI